MMQNKLFKSFIQLVQQKHLLNAEQIKNDPINNAWFREYIASEHYLGAIKTEVDEAFEEYKDNNTVYLEDEVCDILWDYFNLIYFLEQEGKIESIDALLQRAYKKYKERTDALQEGISWNEIKKQQKKELLDEHNKKYGK